MRGHLWLGLLSLPLICFHAGFRFGGLLTTVLMILLIVVVASGIFGAALQHYMPSIVTERVPMETIFEQIGNIRAQLIAEADEMVDAMCGPPSLELAGDCQNHAGRRHHGARRFRWNASSAQIL